MDLRELDRREIANHKLDQLHVDHRGDFYACEVYVDGVLRRWYEPAANVADLNGPDFENYLLAQALGAPVVRSM